MTRNLITNLISHVDELEHLFSSFEKKEKEVKKEYKSLDKSLTFSLHLFDSSSEEEERNMKDEINLEQWMNYNSESGGFEVQRIDLENLNFELKWQLLHLLTEIFFVGKSHEDANQHVEDVIEIV